MFFYPVPELDCNAATALEGAFVPFNNAAGGVVTSVIAQCLLKVSHSKKIGSDPMSCFPTDPRPPGQPGTHEWCLLQTFLTPRGCAAVSGSFERRAGMSSKVVCFPYATHNSPCKLI